MKKNLPKISVYIPSHNYGKYLGNAIDSVLIQTYDNWELIVIDDGSNDNTSEIIKLYKNHEKISFLRTEGIGLPKVCNLALRNSKGEFIIRLDGDDIFDENILLILENCLSKNKNAALAFPDYFLMDKYGEIISIEKREQFYETNHMLDVPPHGACTMIRRSVLNEIGGYREDLGAQDGLDLWTKIRDKYEVKNINLPLFFYRRHNSNLTNNKVGILSARRKINIDSIIDKLPNFYPIIAVVPCRKNFDFIEDLWKSKLNDRSLLERDIETCLNSTLVNKVIVTCDNIEAKKTVEKYDDDRVEFYLRDSKSTIRSSSLVPTLKKIISKFDIDFKGITVIRYLQTPFVTTSILDEAISSLIINDADFSCGVELIEDEIYRKSPYGLQSIGNSKKKFKSDFDSIYKDSNTFSALLNKNIKKGAFTGSMKACFEVSKEESFFINSKRDFEIAKILLAYQKQNGEI